VKVLVTGAGALLGQGILKALRASTLSPTVVAVDPSPTAAGLYWADAAHLVPMASDRSYLDRIRGVLAAERPDIVLIGTDVELPLLAAARAELEQEFGTAILVSSSEVVEIANDKWLTYQFLKRIGVGFVPSCLPGSEEALIEKAGFPLIVKPRVGARSVGFGVIRDRAELRRAIETQPGIVIQKRVGDEDCEYTAGTITFDGKCAASIVMRRDLRDGNTYKAYVDEYPALNEFVRNVASKLGAYGPANFQFRLDDGEPKIFEINGRFSGTTALRHHAGFNEVEMCLRRVLYGEPIAQPAVRRLVLLRHWSETIVEPDALLKLDDAARDG
jgi:carbamoyl-phosphate synthase large subunit